jgi:Zn-dependent protease with chaperone function
VPSIFIPGLDTEGNCLKCQWPSETVFSRTEASRHVHWEGALNLPRRLRGWDVRPVVTRENYRRQLQTTNGVKWPVDHFQTTDVKIPESGSGSGVRDAVGAGWNIPATPPRLEDAQLLEYRHPTELPMLCLALAALAILLAGAVVFKHKAILLGIVGIWLAMIFASVQAVTYNLLRGVEVTPSQFSAVHRMIEELRERFQAPPTRVFVVRQFSVETETLGFRAPYTIVLPSLLLDSLESDELRYVLGRAIGQIRFGHTRIAILLGGDKSTLPDLLSWIAQVRNIIFSGYRRAQVLSADRAGILASGPRVAIETLGKLSLGNSQMREVREEALIDQAYELSRGVSRLQAWLIILLHSAAPPMFLRLRAMVEWAGLPPPKLEVLQTERSDMVS